MVYYSKVQQLEWGAEVQTKQAFTIYTLHVSCLSIVFDLLKRHFAGQGVGPHFHRDLMNG